MKSINNDSISGSQQPGSGNDKSSLDRKLSLDDLKQPEFEKILERFLKVVDLSPLLDLMPVLGPLLSASVKIAQESAKIALENRTEKRLRDHLADSADILTAIQQANRNTLKYVLRSIDFTALKTLLLIERTRETTTFWNVAEQRLEQDKTTIDGAVNTLQRIGLVNVGYLFEHRDGVLRDYQDPNWSAKYTNERLDQLRDQISEMRGLTVVNSKAAVPIVGMTPFQLRQKPVTTIAGFYFLELFEIQAKALRETIPT